MRKLFLLFAVFALALSAQQTPPPAPGGAAGGGRAGGGRGGFPAGPYKNLKVLTQEEVPMNMPRAVAGLGVTCVFCHNPADFSSDEKPQKLVARAHFSMVKDVNARFPDGKPHVTCYTCHRGMQMPLTAPPAAGGRGGAAGGGRGAN